MKATVEQIKFYLLIRKDPPEHKMLYGPLQSLAYIGLMFMVFVIVVTGLILMGAGYHAGFTALCYKILRPIENMMGGLAVAAHGHSRATNDIDLVVALERENAFKAIEELAAGADHFQHRLELGLHEVALDLVDRAVDPLVADRVVHRLAERVRVGDAAEHAGQVLQHPDAVGGPRRPRLAA